MKYFSTESGIFIIPWLNINSVYHVTKCLPLKYEANLNQSAQSEWEWINTQGHTRYRAA